MKPDKKVLESSIVAGMLVLTMTFTAVAHPHQKQVAGGSETKIIFEGTAGGALAMSKSLAGTDKAVETASKEKTNVEVVTAPQMSEEEMQWENRLMARVEDSMNVRAQAGEEAELVGKLRKGDVADIVEQADGWTHIKSGNVDGYVKSELCVTGQDALAYAKTVCQTKASVSGGGLRLRSEANEDSKIYDVVAEGDSLNVATDIQTPEGWVAIQYGDGIAYVASQYVSVSMETGTGITVAEEQEMIAKQKAEEEARKAEEAKKAAAAAAKTATTQKSAVAASCDEVTMLGAVIQLEAGNECYEGKVAVGAVVMNRVRSGGYPGSIQGVVYQGGQFAVRDRIAGTVSSGVSSSCLQAAQEAISGVDNTGGALSFAPVRSGKNGLTIGNHVFY